jgi:hypothetical protein
VVGGGRLRCRGFLSLLVGRRGRDPTIVLHDRRGVDRGDGRWRAITFRTLAVAAMIVLAIAPEALVHPSFQSLGPFSAGRRTLLRNPIEIKDYSPVIGLSSQARKPNKNPNNLGFSV